ncbi:MAG: hypothetical protein K2L73_04145 [Muribaculaceae bacterium]|nr:hypothetical protein [Muribaculaceae bacterium]
MIESVISVSAEEYARMLPKPSTAFGTSAFNQLNSSKAERVEYLVGTDASGRPAMGMVAGLRDGIWRAPFSAPMAALSWHREPSLASVGEFFTKVKERLAPLPLRIMMMPEFIDPVMAAKISGTLINMAREVIAEFNYHYDLTLFPDFEAHLHNNARKNFHRALGAGFTFSECDIARAYDTIRVNRSSKGYYLAMKLNDVIATSSVIPVDAFILSLGTDDVASAIVYRIAPGVAHVVYWGDAPGYEQLRPMNILPYHIFRFYHALGYRIVNIGTSSTDGIPNHGLCNYKESIDCTTSIIPVTVI